MNKSGTRVLLIAYDLKFSGGSEGGAGASALRAHSWLGNQVTLLTQSTTNLAELDNQFGEVEVHGIKVSRILERICLKIPFSEQLRYIAWNFSAHKKLRELIQQNNFDYIHHATYSGDWNPCQALWVKEVKVVWGPVGGAQQIPLRHLLKLGPRGLMKQLLYLLITTQLRKFNRWLAWRNRITVLAVNKVSEKFFKERCETKMMNQISFESGAFAITKKKERISDSTNVNIVGIGRLIPLKFWNVLIAAMAYLPHNYRLAIIGDGIEMNRLKRQVLKQNLGERVQLLGEFSYGRTLEQIYNSDIVAFPSMKDSSPWVIAESLSLGTPVIAFDVCGVRELVSNSYPLVKIDGNIVKNFAEAIHKFEINRVDYNFCSCKLAYEYSKIFT